MMVSTPMMMPSRVRKVRSLLAQRDPIDMENDSAMLTRAIGFQPLSIILYEGEKQQFKPGFDGSYQYLKEV